MRQGRRCVDSYWIVMCVFLFYQQPINALSFVGHTSADVRNNEGRRGYTEKETRGIEENDSSQSSGECHHGWQTYDGTECVCATNDTTRCLDKSTVVCDNQNSRYPSTCHFSLGLCQGLISHHRQIISCGSCEGLVLRSETTIGDGELLFIRDGADKGYQTVYRSNHDGYKLFFDETIQVWVVGKRTASGAMIIIMQPFKMAYPQDNEGGMLISVKKESGSEWQFDHNMRLECSKAHFQKRSMQKRFFFLVALAVIAVIASATATTVKVIQAKKGCLFYPSACRMRDEIKNHLKPEVVRLRDSFHAKYNNASGMKYLVEVMEEQVLDVREAIVTIQKLHTNLEFSMSNLTDHIGNLQTEFPKFGDVLKNYDSWSKSVKIDALFSYVGLEIDIITTAYSLPSLLAATTSTFSLAAAGIGSVFAIGYAIVDIISSIKQEKKVKENLEKVKRTLETSKSNLQAAFRNMKEFQEKFCLTIVDYLRDLSDKGKRYHQSFADLTDLVSYYYGNSKSECSNEYIYSHTNYVLLQNFKNAIDDVLNYLKENALKLNKKIFEIDQMDEFIKQIKVKVEIERVEPVHLFNSVKKYKPAMSDQLFKNLFEFLEYISKDLLPRINCYWGYDLDNVRKGITTESNYLTSPICSSSEISRYDTIIRKGVADTKIPCIIATEVHGNLFRSKYLVMRYIADHVLTSSNCYWGYDLDAIRKTPNINEINEAMMKSTIFSTLVLLGSGRIDLDKIKMAKQMICSETKICSDQWQSFILCAAWKDHNEEKLLGCNWSYPRDKCLPPTSSYQICSHKNLI